MRAAPEPPDAIVAETPGKAARHARIVAIVAAGSVHSQAQLAQLLQAEGLHVTQATLSRDLEELGAVKLRTPDGGLPVYVIPEDGAPLATRSAETSSSPRSRASRMGGASSADRVASGAPSSGMT